MSPSSAERGGRTHWFSWAARISWGLLDQAVYSLSTFVFHVLLARWMTPQEYGLFAVLFVLLLFVQGIHSALVSEPMSVLGPARYGDRLAAYASASLRLHLWPTAVAVLLPALVAAALALTGRPAAAPVLALAVAVLPFLSQLMLRRVCYLFHGSLAALVLSLVYAAVLIGGSFAAGRQIGATGACLLLAAASAAGCAAYPLTARRRPRATGEPPPLARVAAENWAYGRWILSANAAHWLGVGAYVPLVGWLTSLAAAGAFRALQNLVAPAIQFLISLALVLLPWLAGQRLAGARLRRRLLSLWALLLPPVALYGALLVLFGRRLVDLLYAQPAYSDQAPLLVGFALFALVTAAAHALSLVLRSTERAAPIFWSKLASMAVTLGVGLPLTWRYGLAGAVAGVVLAVAGEVVLLAAVFPWRQGAGEGEAP